MLLGDLVKFTQLNVQEDVSENSVSLTFYYK